MTIQEFTDNIISTFKRTTPIRYVTRRHVFNVAKPLIATLLNQQRSDYSLGSFSNLVVNLDCLEMERVDPVICGIPELKRCSMLMRSKCKLTGMLYNRNGASIISVSDADYSGVFTRTTFQKYRVESSRRGFVAGREKFYFIKDEYLYTIDCPYKILTVSYITLDTFNTCSCNRDKCLPNYKYPMPITDKIKSTVVSQVQQELGINIQIHSGKSERE